MKPIILCADDYGQNAVISQAIIELIKAKRLSATSCLTTAPDWEEYGILLSPFKDDIDAGLHLNLTEGKPLSDALPEFFSLKTLILKAFTHQLDKIAIATEFRAQFDKFIEIYGHPPQFLDGHQHIHQLPDIRDMVIDLYNEKMREQNAYVRSTYTPGNLWRFSDVGFGKQLLIQFLGGIAFHEKIVEDSIPHNSSFAGIYRFSDAAHYDEFFPRFLQQIKAGGLIMCHPGMMGNDHDEIMEARHHEYIYFSSQRFTKACADYGIKIVRFENLAKK